MQMDSDKTEVINQPSTSSGKKTNAEICEAYREQRPLLKEFHTTLHYVIGTDYDNYAVVHSCTRIPNGRTLSIYKVLNRDPAVRIIRKVNPVLEEIGLSLFDFTPIDHNNCVDDTA